MAAVGGVFQNAEQGRNLVGSCTKFAWDLFGHLNKEKAASNVFFSPASISMALAMTYVGARATTADQMKAVLHYADVHEDHLHPSFSDLVTGLNPAAANYTLKLANRLYVQQEFKLLKEFLDVTQKHYHVEAKQVDYKGDTEGARVIINKWVEEQTVQKIKDLLPSGSLNPLVRLVLVNAIYFKGDWNNKFDKKDTKKADFHISATEKIQVDMMYQKKKFQYGYNDELKCRALELPYKDRQLSMVILLPDDVEGITQLESKLSAEQIAHMEKTFRMREVEVHVNLPRFKMEQSFNLVETLGGMGMKDLFVAGGADLSGVDGSHELFVSKVVHKAFIEVNEEGSEAAAATGVVMMLRCMPMRTEFNANHPFLFYIRHNPSGAALFLGKMQKPTAAEETQHDEL